jgi:hypothetical protein
VNSHDIAAGVVLLAGKFLLIVAAVCLGVGALIGWWLA